MTRGISATNVAEIDASHFHEVILAKLEFDTPVYVHSGFGDIVFGGDTYLGVGDFGGITEGGESTALTPTSITLPLSGVDSAYITEALDAGNYGDIITIYVGYRQDDGTLVDDPWLYWRGQYEYASLSQGSDNVVAVHAQHELMVLNEADGSRFTEEDQVLKFAGDKGFNYLPYMISLKLAWAGGRVGSITPGGEGGGGGAGGGRGRFPDIRF